MLINLIRESQDVISNSFLFINSSPVIFVPLEYLPNLFLHSNDELYFNFGFYNKKYYIYFEITAFTIVKAYKNIITSRRISNCCNKILCIYIVDNLLSLNMPNSNDFIKTPRHKHLIILLLLNYTLGQKLIEVTILECSNLP